MLQKLQHLHGYDVLECGTSDPEDLADGSRRADKREVVLRDRLREALGALNPEIPALFLANAVCLLSNARETRLGAFAADWEFFLPWLRAEDGKERIDRDAVKREGTSLEQVLAGLLPKARLLDYVENFVLHHRDRVKIVAQNHQFLGVNKAFAAFVRREARGGKLGVFRHTQGSGNHARQGLKWAA